MIMKYTIIPRRHKVNRRHNCLQLRCFRILFDDHSSRSRGQTLISSAPADYYYAGIADSSAGFDGIERHMSNRKYTQLTPTAAISAVALQYTDAEVVALKASSFLPLTGERFVLHTTLCSFSFSSRSLAHSLCVCNLSLAQCEALPAYSQPESRPKAQISARKLAGGF